MTDWQNNKAHLEETIQALTDHDWQGKELALVANGIGWLRILKELVYSPHTQNFLEGVQLESAFQVARWGDADKRNKSAEAWFWLVGYLSSKALRAAITGDKEKAQHHCISSAAALNHWHDRIAQDTTGSGAGSDPDLAVYDSVAGN